MRTHRRILVIDHDPQTTRLLRRWVGLTGVDVFAARSGWEHVEEGLKRRPSLILLSADVPGALDVQERLAASPDARDIPLAVVYGEHTEPTLRAALEERVRARLRKPLDPLAVKPVLEGVFGRVPMRRGTSPGLELPSLPSRPTPAPAPLADRAEAAGGVAPGRVPTSPGTPSPARPVARSLSHGEADVAAPLGPREPTVVDAGPVAPSSPPGGVGGGFAAEDDEPTLHDNEINPDLVAALLREQSDELERTRGELSALQKKLAGALADLYEAEARSAELEAQLAVRPEPTRPGIVNDPVVQARLDRLERERDEARAELAKREVRDSAALGELRQALEEAREEVLALRPLAEARAESEREGERLRAELAEARADVRAAADRVVAAELARDEALVRHASIQRERDELSDRVFALESDAARAAEELAAARAQAEAPAAALAEARERIRELEVGQADREAAYAALERERDRLAEEVSDGELALEAAAEWRGELEAARDRLEAEVAALRERLLVAEERAALAEARAQDSEGRARAAEEAAAEAERRAQEAAESREAPAAAPGSAAELARAAEAEAQAAEVAAQLAELRAQVAASDARAAEAEAEARRARDELAGAVAAARSEGRQATTEAAGQLGLMAEQLGQARAALAAREAELAQERRARQALEESARQGDGALPVEQDGDTVLLAGDGDLVAAVRRELLSELRTFLDQLEGRGEAVVHVEPELADPTPGPEEASGGASKDRLAPSRDAAPRGGEEPEGEASATADPAPDDGADRAQGEEAASGHSDAPDAGATAAEAAPA